MAMLNYQRVYQFLADLWWIFLVESMDLFLRKAVDSGWNSVRILVEKTDGFHHVGVGSGAGGWFEEDFGSGF